MTMHETPLTTVEEAGLIAQGFGRDIGKPSMAVDIFRLGMFWALLPQTQRVAHIDSLIQHEMPVDGALRARLTELVEEMRDSLKIIPEMRLLWYDGKPAQEQRLGRALSVWLTRLFGFLMCNHIPKCTTRPQHINRIYAEMASIDDSNLVIGDLSKADYLWAIRWGRKRDGERKSANNWRPKMTKITFETFKHLSDYDRRNLTENTPYCFNGNTYVEKFKVTVEKVDEPVEVLHDRLRKMWDECTNSHHRQPLLAAGFKHGIDLRIPEGDPQ